MDSEEALRQIYFWSGRCEVGYLTFEDLHFKVMEVLKEYYNE